MNTTLSPQMRDYMARRKETFIVRETKQIDVYEQIIKVLENMKGVITAFNGKVVNKRLETKMRNEISENGRYSITLAYDYNSWSISIGAYKHEDRCFYYPKGSLNTDWGGYIKSDSVKIYDAIPNQTDGRLNAVPTCERIDKQIDYLKQRIAELQDCIANIDAYLEETFKIEQMIKEYDKKVPFELRRNIVVNDWFGL